MNNKIPCNTHELKILPKWFEDVQTNKKNFEIRKNDRNFEVGDYLILKEWHRGKFTDRYVIRQIEYIYKGDGTYGLTEDYCVLGLKVPQAEKQWIPCSERLPKPFTYVNATCRSLVDNRENWVVETLYLPIPKENNEQGYSDWGNIPMINWGKAEVIAWMERKIPEPYKAETENEE